MSSFTWRMNSIAEEQDERPACASCRKRKLRCSRDLPTCQNCNRNGIQCAYDPKSKPGLKTGAVEALSRRLAVLESLLLDEHGTPLVDFTKDSQDTRQHNQGASGTNTSETTTTIARSRDISDEEGNAISATFEYEQCCHHCEWRTRSSNPDYIDTFTFNGAKHHLLQALPARRIVVEVVDYFCVTFHHWIPFLHKAKCQAAVRNADTDPEFAPVLHALVAVVLPRLNTASLCIDHAQVHQQTRVSRGLALQYAVANASLQSLQTLLILVFEQLNDGQILQTCPLIALLVRTVDFLQLATEPGASRSQVLMKPVEVLEPATDWTELEARRRLFWCIFLLDRYTSVYMGWNISLTGDDVHRRLPADGGYFTREVPVQCPFFGIWTKAYANIGSSLSAHVPAQYREESPPTGTAELDSTTPTSQASIDSSKLGAFAYSIEAIESLNQVTTFFLQRRIDWQNRQHVLDWLTRFKELDLRLIHWKMFLPPRWKDSNISIDTSRIDMDPNLTLAHLMHNTSMILLHYPVAFPPVEWAEVVQLPSSCSIETCQMAAIEISRITDKFLRHTSIPFVNPQFAFCVYIAAKLLLIASHTAHAPISSEFDTLLGSLWLISAHWLQLDTTSGHSARAMCINHEDSSDLAGSYARHAEKLQQTLRANPNYQMDFFDHSGTRAAHDDSTPLSSTKDAQYPQRSSGEPFEAMGTTGEVATPNLMNRRSTKQPVHQMNRIAVSKPTATPGRRQSRRQRQPQLSSRHTQVRSPNAMVGPVHFSPANSNGGANISMGPSAGNELPAEMQMPPDDTTHPRPSASRQLPNQHLDTIGLPTDEPVWPQDALFDLSDTLMQPQFLQQDRVITFEDMYFRMDGMDWS